MFPDLLVLKTSCGQEDSLGTNNVTIRRRIFTRHLLKAFLLFSAQNDLIRAIPGHIAPPDTRYDTRNQSDEQ